jgi:folylpolyglutamate synthase/dihydrofolate synthase
VAGPGGADEHGLAYREAQAAIWARGVEWRDLDPSLDRIRALTDLLGDPQRGYPVIHVTGTNGKSTTVRMIDALLRERGLRVGSFTSPSLHTMRDRITIDGEPVSPERFAAAYADVAPYVEMVDAGEYGRMSFFEVLTGMAFAAFADAPVDVAVFEVGLGGAWDATNVADGQVAVVTPIDIDHTRLLGETVEEIAGEKAGIIKPHAVAVLAQQSVEAARVLLERSVEVEATVAREGLEFGVLHREFAVGGQQVQLRGLHGTYDDVFLPLYGAHQAHNAACALAAVEAFASGRGAFEAGAPDDVRATGAGDLALDPELVRGAFARVTSPGRLEVVRRGPTVLVDSAHNPAGMAASAEAVDTEFGFTRLIGVVAVMGDKDVSGVLAHLESLLTAIVVTRNSAPRSMPAEELGELAVDMFGPERVHVVPRLDEAIDRGLALAEETGEFVGVGVLITGSVVTAADARTLLRVPGAGSAE